MRLTHSTLVLAVVLIVVGLVAYLATGRQSVTALIPAFLGVPLLVCALLARREGARRGALGTASVLALLGLGGTASGLVKTARLIGGATLERPEAAVTQAVVAVACLAYLVLALRALRQARRSRTSEAAA